MTEAAGQSADPVAADFEQALTMLAWNDPAVVTDPVAALLRLGVDVPAGQRFDVGW